VTDLDSHGWSHAEPEKPLLLCVDHRASTKRLDDHRSNQIANQCLKCIALNHPNGRNLR